jgi:hypothetical protein
MFIFNEELYVANVDTNSVRGFPLTANGDAVPTRSIVGLATNINNALGVFVY